MSSFQEKIEKYQKQISHTRVFGNGITRERRLEMFEVIQDIQKNVSDKQQNYLLSYDKKKALYYTCSAQDEREIVLIGCHNLSFYGEVENYLPIAPPYLGLVGQSIISLTSSLRGQLVQCITTL